MGFSLGINLIFFTFPEYFIPILNNLYLSVPIPKFLLDMFLIPIVIGASSLIVIDFAHIIWEISTGYLISISSIYGITFLNSLLTLKTLAL